MSELTEALILVVLLFIISIFLVLVNDYNKCKSIGKILNYKTEWSFQKGCTLIKPEGSLVLGHTGDA